jgi:hypothetical protein
MSTRPFERKPLNIATLINIINSLQMALSKLLKELLELQRAGNVYLFRDDRGSSTAVDESCGDPFESGAGVDESCGSYEDWAVDESCGQADFEDSMRTAVDESCGDPGGGGGGEGGVGPVDERCGDPIVPPTCDPESIDILCRNIIRISIHLRKICWIVRRNR